MLVSLRYFPLASFVLDQQARYLRNDPYPRYRQFAQMPSYGTQPSSLFLSRREHELEIIPTPQRHVNRIAPLARQPLPARRRDWQGCRLDRNSYRGGLGDLADPIRQTIEGATGA